MKFSEDAYSINSSLTRDEVSECLLKNTLIRNILAYTSTSKSFIGNVKEFDFSIIGSWFPLGPACVVKGRIEENVSSNILLTTSVNKAFRILFYVWSVLVGGVLVFRLILDPISIASLISLLLFAFGAIMFRLFIHAIYVLARNRVLKKLKLLFEDR